MKRILIPTDFSPCAQNATQVGAAIAKATGAEILLLHIIYSPLGLEKLPSKLADYPEMKEAVLKAKRQLNKEVSSAALKKLKVETKLDVGTPARDIVYYTKSWKADLVAIGTHGTAEADHPFVGSNAQKVLRGADCPVLSVQKNHTVKNLKKFVFASNFDERSIKPFEKILVLAKALNASVEFLHICTPINFKSTRTIQTMMDNFAQNFPDVKFTRALYTDFEVHNGISSYLEENPQGIVALATRTRQYQPSYTLGVTESVAFHSPVPVLSVNMK
ncbi:MAG: universal stress protein [Cyclobacteriaceae bacterium]|jgi:nucleotide-binding universal stress UspA family protein|nr:universal stress protein [Cyclobacteriaceae bacterium]